MKNSFINYISSLTKFNECDVAFETTRKVYLASMVWAFSVYFVIAIPILTVSIHFTGEANVYVSSFCGILLGFILTPAVMMRRLQDAGYNKWWWFISFIPVVCMVFYIFLGVKDSKDCKDEMAAYNI